MLGRGLMYDRREGIFFKVEFIFTYAKSLCTSKSYADLVVKTP
jgi:hypothetical protein